jgi:hypothetical protein
MAREFTVAPGGRARAGWHGQDDAIDDDHRFFREARQHPA